MHYVYSVLSLESAGKKSVNCTREIAGEGVLWAGGREGVSEQPGDRIAFPPEGAKKAVEGEKKPLHHNPYFVSGQAPKCH